MSRCVDHKGLVMGTPKRRVGEQLAGSARAGVIVGEGLGLCRQRREAVPSQVEALAAALSPWHASPPQCLVRCCVCGLAHFVMCVSPVPLPRTTVPGHDYTLRALLLLRCRHCVCLGTLVEAVHLSLGLPVLLRGSEVPRLLTAPARGAVPWMLGGASKPLSRSRPGLPESSSYKHVGKQSAVLLNLASTWAKTIFWMCSTWGKHCGRSRIRGKQCGRGPAPSGT